MNYPIILICAPVGYGKTTAVAQWLKKNKRPSTWLNSNPILNDLSSFLECFINSVESIFPEKMQSSRNLIPGSDLLTNQSMADNIAGDIWGIEEEFVFVLDDYHLIDDEDTREFISYLMNILPPNIQFVICTRHDCFDERQFSKLMGKILFLTKEDLRLREDEIDQFLRTINGENLDLESLSDISNRIDGWILGFRLITTSMVLTGNSKILHSNIEKQAELIIKDISNHLPEEFDTILRFCSLCDRFCSKLIDDWIEQEGILGINGYDFIETLRKVNMFLIPLDNTNQWFRFHHFFNELLHLKYRHLNPNKTSDDNYFLSKWFFQEGYYEDSLQFAIESERFDWVCEIVEIYRPIIQIEDRSWSLQFWIDQIPFEEVHSCIDLIMAKMWILEKLWNLNELPPLIDQAERLLHNCKNKKHESELLFHKGHYVLFCEPNFPKALDLLEASKTKFTDTGVFGAQRELLIAFAKQMSGNGNAALADLEEQTNVLDRNSIYYSRGILLPKILVQMLMGNFNEAHKTSRLFSKSISKELYQTTCAWSYYCRGNICYQKFRLKEASEYLDKLKNFKGVLNSWAYIDSIIALVEIYHYLGYSEKVKETLKRLEKEANEFKVETFHNVLDLAENKLKWLTDTNPQEVLNWASTTRSEFVRPTDVMCTMAVSDLIIGKILITSGSKKQVMIALEMIQSLSDTLSKVNNRCHLVDCLFLMSIANYRISRIDIARYNLKEALSRAHIDGVIRPIYEFGETFPEIFELVGEESISTEIQHLINKVKLKSILSRITSPGLNRNSSELTSREVEILNFISDGMRNKEIAEKANVALTTVKSHVSNIFRKLEVKNRTSLIRKAKELHLLE